MPKLYTVQRAKKLNIASKILITNLIIENFNPSSYLIVSYFEFNEFIIFPV